MITYFLFSGHITHKTKLDIVSDNVIVILDTGVIQIEKNDKKTINAFADNIREWVFQNFTGDMFFLGLTNPSNVTANLILKVKVIFKNKKLFLIPVGVNSN